MAVYVIHMSWYEVHGTKSSATMYKVKMFDLRWYEEWEEGGDASTWGKMCDFIDVTRCVPCSPSELF
eukprot:SAG31_NODE_3206_length_4554_cov_4.595960_4_plen_67_part_00